MLADVKAELAYKYEVPGLRPEIHEMQILEIKLQWRDGKQATAWTSTM